jgi:AraC-like DNA-binding protein
MPRSVTFELTDPVAYRAAMRNGEGDVLIAAKGRFRIALTQTDLNRLWIQCGDEELPRVLAFSQSRERSAIAFLADAKEANVQCAGFDMGPGDIVVTPAGTSFHERTSGPCRWRAMSLPAHDFSAASQAILGRDQSVGSVAHMVRPDPTDMARLLRLQGEAQRLILTAPEMAAHPEVSRALEHALVHSMITCLAAQMPTEVGKRWRHHSAIIGRFEELLVKNSDRPMHLPEICAAVGVSERTLRACCEEHLGMGPIRYLWLRRMHLARRALVLGDPAETTVTQTATEYGFWELGRFAVSYRQLFGEPPSATLQKSSRGHRSFGDRPIAFANASAA